MKKLLILLPLLMMGSLFGVTEAAATMSASYAFTQGAGVPTDMSTGTTQTLGPDLDDVTSTFWSIGFVFRLDGVSHSTFHVSSNGFIRLGNTAPTNSDNGNAFDASAFYPLIAPFWDDLRTVPTDGYVRHKVTGVAPNRVLTVEFRTRYWSSTTSGPWNYQLRLYETTDKIEFLYISMPSNFASTATIGVGVASGNFASITPSATATVSYTTSNNSVNLNSTPITPNRMFTFTPCDQNISISGTPSQGGTAAMNNNDQLLTNQDVVIGNIVDVTPYTIRNGGLIYNGCASRTYTYTLTGGAASDYTFLTPMTGTLAPGATNTPTIRFMPSAYGERVTTLTVRDNNGFTRTYTLRGEGLRRIEWTGNIADGGTPTVTSGDVLMTNIEVERNEVGTFQPLTLRNFGINPAAPPAIVNYSLIDPTGQYSIDRSIDLLSAGQQASPVITFAPTLTGEQRATLRIEVDGEVRTYTLAAYSVAPAAEFRFDNALFASGSGYFSRDFICVGEMISVPVTITNINRVDFVVSDIVEFATANQIGQGTPRYPILRDGSGNPIDSWDYIVTDAPATFPMNTNEEATLPIVIAPGGTRTVYLNFMPNRPDPRYARLFIRTNGENFVGFEIGSFDPGGTAQVVEGLFTLDLFGKGLGSDLAGLTADKQPAPILFEPANVRETQIASTWIENKGPCDLRITRSELKIMSGDVEEFKLLSVLPNTTVAGDYYVLAPGQGDSIVASFTPLTFGSRRATVRLETNDSTLGLEGVTERGSFYLDLFGTGRVGLESTNLTFAPAVIDLTTSKGRIFFTNTSGGIVNVTGIQILGANGEIIPDPASPWPGTLQVDPGEGFSLDLLLQPAPGSSPGVRQAQVRVAINGGDTAIATVTGYAGTRTLTATPSALFTNVQTKVGQISRAFVAVTNTGTLPIRLSDPTITGANLDHYRVSAVVRRTIEPGTTEFFEVTFEPLAPGASSASLTFTGNGTNPPVVIALGGQGVAGTILVGGGSGNAASGRTQMPGEGMEFGRTTAPVAGSGHEAALSIAPNPARGLVMLNYTLPSDGGATIEIYDASGRRVRMHEMENVDAGEGQVQIDLSGIASGTYRCVVRQGETVVSRDLVVTR